MADLFNQQISATYSGLLKTTSNGILSSSLAQITDGRGNDSPLSMSTTEIQFNTGSNTFKFPTTRGTSGQILKLADANGTLDWVADASGDVTKTGTIALNTIAVWNDNADQLRSDTTMSINTNHTISLLQPNSVPTDVNSYNIGGGNIANVTGSRNVGFGKQNLNAVLAGSDNTAMGDGSLEKVTSGNSNTGFGSDALGNSTDGDFNTAVGSGALNDVLTGENNTAVGYNAGVNVSTGSGNTYIGKSAGLVDVGSNNIYIGEGSGSSVASGNNNVILGSNTGNTISATSNNIIISDGSGNNRIQVDSGGDATFSGNVLIGTNINSDIPLQVNKETAASGTAIAFLRNTDAAGNGLVVDVTTPQDYVADFRIGNVSKMRISSGGDVGVGNTNPSDYDSDANNLVVGSLSGNNGITILSAAASGFGSLYFADGTTVNKVNSGYIRYQQNQSVMSFGVNAAEAMRISLGGLATFSNDIELSRAARTTIYASSTNQGVQLKSNGSGVLQLNADGGGNVTIAENGGNVGIGITPENSTGTWRNLQFGGGNIVFRSSGNNGAFFGTNYLFKTNNSEVYKDSAATSRMYFADDVIKIQQAGIGTAGNSVVWTTPLTISSGGDVGIGINPTAGYKLDVSGGDVRFGAGLKFGSGSTLNAYEEGTWTGTMLNTGTSPNPTATGTYTRIGDIVYIQIYFASRTINSAGLTRVSGLPFSGASSGTLGYPVISYLHGDSILNCKGGYVAGTTIYNILNNSTGETSWATGTKSSMWSGTYKT